MSSKIEKSLEFFSLGYNCAQSIFAVFADELEMSADTCLKVSCAFGAGIARNQKTCGAVTGALMVLGMKYGRGINEPVENKFHTYSISNELIKEFIKRHKTVSCKELMQGLDMNTEEGAAKLKELGLHDKECPLLIKSAVEITEELVTKNY